MSNKEKKDIKDINDIKYIFYINLDSRPDRKIHIETQMKQLGLSAMRFNAIKHPLGYIGCSISHLKCLERAKQENWDHVLIVEDDILFTNVELFKSQMNAFLKNHQDFDVVLIAGNNIPPYQKVDETCIKITKCQTTTGYLVKSHYYDTLLQNYKEGIVNLIGDPRNHKSYAIDQYWFQLQQKDNWYLIIPLSVVQKEDYSDIEKMPTNYKNIMLDLDKKEFFKNIKNT